MSLNNLRFKSRILILVGLFLGGLLTTHVMYGVMLGILRVNGPIYSHILLGKDIINSIQPINNSESYIAAVNLLHE